MAPAHLVVRPGSRPPCHPMAASSDALIRGQPYDCLGMAADREAEVPGILPFGGYWATCCTMMVCPADLSRSVSAAPIAVAGVRTPARSGRRARSSARQRGPLLSITHVAADPRSPRASVFA